MKEPDLPNVILNEDSIERAIKIFCQMRLSILLKTVELKIRAERARVGEFVELSIEDQGPGIADEHQNKIFERFFRVENDTHTIKGTGLGLHLVKISVEKHHGGQVFIQSKTGEGSTFGFRLPINPPKEEETEHPPIIMQTQENGEQLQPPPEDDLWEVSLEKRELS